MMTTDGRKSPVHVHVDRETPVHVHLKKKKKGKPGVPTAVEVCRVHPIKNNDCRTWLSATIRALARISPSPKMRQELHYIKVER